MAHSSSHFAEPHATAVVQADNFKGWNDPEDGYQLSPLNSVK
jgi:hypothetical protein